VRPRVPDQRGPNGAVDAATDASDGGQGNLLVNPTFTLTGLGCGLPWATNNQAVQLARVDGGVPGEDACLVCTTVKGTGITQAVDFADAAPSSFQVGIGGRIAASPPEQLARVQFQGDVHLVDGGRVFMNVPTGAVVVDAGGTSLDPTSGSGQMAFTNALKVINFSVVEQDDDGGCFILEDPTLLVVP